MQGDLNLVQIVAKNIAAKYDSHTAFKNAEIEMKHLDSLFESWLYLEHHEAYEAIKKKESEEQSVQFGEIDRQSMKPLIEKMKRLAAMERDKARG